MNDAQRVQPVPGIDGSVVAITGGNQGIGRAIALACARAGADLALSSRSRESLEAVAAEVEGLGRRALAVTCDVSDEGSVEEMGARVLETFGRVDHVIANAGIAGPTRPLHEITYAEWRECLGIDLDGVYLTFRRFLPGMLQAGRGTLTAISSVTGKKPLLNRSPYAAAKLGVIGLVRTLALETGPHGIRVNSICPGAVSGPRIEAVIAGQAVARGMSPERVRAEMNATAALNRFVEADEIAAACVFLASDAAAAITGEDLNVTAGRVMY